MQDQIQIKNWRAVVEFLKGKSQLSELELVETRRRLHQLESMLNGLWSVLKVFRFLPSSMSNIVNQALFVCAVLSHSILHCVYDVSTNMDSKYVYHYGHIVVV